MSRQKEIVITVTYNELGIIVDIKAEPLETKLKQMAERKTESQTSRENTRDSRDNHEIAKDEPQTEENCDYCKMTHKHWYEHCDVCDHKPKDEQTDCPWK